MIREVKGDILKTKAQTIAHGIAPMDPMSQGLALALHQKYPTMHKDFHHWCHAHNPQPGDAWLWEGPDGERIVNLITQAAGEGHQAHPLRAKVSDVNHTLRSLRKLVAKHSIESLALPRLATGVGGLDWKDVKPLIGNHLADVGVPVDVFVEFHAGGDPTPVS
jgi:O-acetyl-ADP-ribose deacetylase (regulator of RNase III)